MVMLTTAAVCIVTMVMHLQCLGNSISWCAWQRVRSFYLQASSFKLQATTQLVHGLKVSKRLCPTSNVEATVSDFKRRAVPRVRRSLRKVESPLQLRGRMVSVRRAGRWRPSICHDGEQCGMKRTHTRRKLTRLCACSNMENA